MNKIELPIDTKSLYLNIRNDNLKGHTCTVATPIKQGHSLRSDLDQIRQIPKQLSPAQRDDIVDILIKKSKTATRVNNVFIFDKIKVNNEVVDVHSCFCMFIKEEIDQSKVQYGRTMLHYPISLKIPNLNIDNKDVLEKISEMYHNYAFIIEGFEYDLSNGYLNFKLLVVGYNNIPYSKVFVNNKGSGSKYNDIAKNYIDSYDVEIGHLRQLYGEAISTENYEEEINLATQVAKRVVFERLSSEGASDIRDISEQYQYSLYDFQYYKNGHVNYAIVFPTFSNAVYFNLSIYQSNFCHMFSNANVFVVYNIGEENKMKIDVINSNNINSLDRFVNSYRYVKVE